MKFSCNSPRVVQCRSKHRTCTKSSALGIHSLKRVGNRSLFAWWPLLFRRTEKEILKGFLNFCDNRLFVPDEQTFLTMLKLTNSISRILNIRPRGEGPFYGLHGRLRSKATSFSRLQVCKRVGPFH